jgi:hypothetical protein
MDCLKKWKERSKLIVPKKEKKCVERYFFKYAFPCARVKLKLGSLTQEKYDELERIFLENDFPDKEVLEKTFPPAFRRIGNLAEKRDKEMWDESVVEEYWTKNHNEIIDDGDGMYGEASEEFKDLCKVHEAEIVEKGQNSLIVRYDGKERRVSDFLVKDVSVGDKVRIHFAFAIEIV